MDTSRQPAASAPDTAILILAARLYAKKDALKLASERSDSVSAACSVCKDSSEVRSFSSRVFKVNSSVAKLACEAVSCSCSDDERAFNCPEIVNNRVISVAEMV